MLDLVNLQSFFEKNPLQTHKNKTPQTLHKCSGLAPQFWKVILCNFQCGWTVSKIFFIILQVKNCTVVYVVNEFVIAGWLDLFV